MQFRFLLNAEQKIVAAKNYTLAGISYLLRIFFYVIENSLFTDFWKRGIILL